MWSLRAWSHNRNNNNTAANKFFFFLPLPRGQHGWKTSCFLALCKLSDPSWSRATSICWLCSPADEGLFKSAADATAKINELCCSFTLSRQEALTWPARAKVSSVHLTCPSGKQRRWIHDDMSWTSVLKPERCSCHTRVQSIVRFWKAESSRLNEALMH